MPIRIKILLIILLTAIPPIFFLRFTGMESMNELAGKVETRTEKLLLQNISTSLQRIVHDHARLLKRESQLINAALDILANDAASAISSSQVPIRNVESDDEMVSAMQGKDHHEEMMKRGGICIFSHSKRIKKDLSLLVPTLEEFANRYPDLILWQQVRLLDNSQLFLPTKKGASEQQCLFGDMAPPSLEHGSSWSRPMHDPIFNSSIFTASQNIYVDDKVIGTVTIAVPVSTLLRDPGHLSKLSSNVTSYLVYATPEGDVLTVATRTPGKEEGRWFTSPNTDIDLDAGTSKQISRNILQGKGSLLSTSIDGVGFIIVYAPLGIGKTALLISVPRIDVVRDAAKETDVIRSIFTHQMDTSQLLLTGTVLLLGIMAIVLSGSLSKNIHKLVYAVREVGTGNFSVRIEDVGKDEIGELGKAINEMVPSLEENVHLKSSLQLASVVQRKLLPHAAPSPPSYDIAGASFYCAETGGDYYDFIDFASGSASEQVMAVGDVVGHGVPAALLMATARAYLRSCTRNDFALSEITRKANELVAYDTFGTGQFMTLYLASLDTLTNTLTWTRAGHDAAMVYRRSESQFVEFKGMGGTALGVTTDVTYPENSEKLLPGDIVVMATDGIWEARSPEGTMFGKELMKTIIRDNSELSSQDLIDKLYSSALDYAQQPSLEDDFTCIVIKCLSKK
ncbi:PP2C family protein-serine/threonine phosphatase [Halodesulfovibrio marinisediminis]|uniref:Sigma-B regulation protein RsbU (Phosphoserine phosphatase) n=1 Tax=Halodesulfovibrio marinisediminis DSM 17456 TaxID=1121457 RepID=A0A1N6E922_9BACT|nr:PP2C family protein-serine/threonine phosphatase [Halodesulfovibrio marinisediminis]SIN79417.1 sigma-B regulation protein RsbU (phosphoserine phosphatase) [Halodesulfovibrio marinisediminis DSM 17456]